MEELDSGRTVVRHAALSGLRFLQDVLLITLQHVLEQMRGDVGGRAMTLKHFCFLVKSAKRSDSKDIPDG